MFDPTGPVLGIDPGVSRCGYGAVAGRTAAVRGSDCRAVAYGVIRTPTDLELPERLGRLQTELEELIEEVRPSALAVERVLFQVNVRTAMSVGQASGLALATAARAGIPVAQYSPNEVKLAVAGYGGAEKAAVQAMVVRLLALPGPPGSPDAADALALALCHLWGAKLHDVRGTARAPAAGYERAVAARAGEGGPEGQSCEDDGLEDDGLEDHGIEHHGPGGPMIGSVRGTVLERSASGEVLVEVGGVGYRCLVPVGAIPALVPAAPAFLFTHLHVREDAMTLYGFPTRDERDTFEMLISASGVGPKLGLAMLSVHPPASLRRCVADDDLDSLCLVPGVGKRTAQKLMIELKNRLGVPDVDLVEPGGEGGGPTPRAEVRAALTELGYGPEEVRVALNDLPADGTIGDLLRAALKRLAVRA